MPTGKRASMREGPLAALFRKTADDAPKGDKPPAKSEVPPAQTPAARRTEPVPEPPAEPAEVQIPSPQERLRQAFSTDIPQSLLDPPAGQEAAAPVDPYVRPQRPPEPTVGSPAFGRPVIRVVGVGGAGVNAVNRMVEAEVEGVEFVAINTDLQSLQQSTADITLHIGAALTRGLGSGSNPDLGRQAAMDEYDRIKALLKGSDMDFITAGAGGGTGTGAAPIVARIARELGALTVGIVTKPFGFEGSRRGEQAQVGIQS